MAPVDASLGVAFGALLARLAGWPWMFFMVSIVCVFLAFLASFVLPAPQSPPMRISFKEKLQDMNWLGAFSGTAALVCINIAWNCAPAQGWKTQYIFMLLILRLVLAASCVLIETQVAPRPLLPFKIFRGEVGFVLASIGFG
jgi:hypothetical protein